MFDFFKFREAFGIPPQLAQWGSLMLFYGLYYGVLDRDCAEMCADRIQQRLGVREWPLCERDLNVVNRFIGTYWGSHWESLPCIRIGTSLHHNNVFDDKLLQRRGVTTLDCVLLLFGRLPNVAHLLTLFESLSALPPCSTPLTLQYTKKGDDDAQRLLPGTL